MLDWRVTSGERLHAVSTHSGRQEGDGDRGMLATSLYREAASRKAYVFQHSGALCSWEWSPHGPVTSSRTCLSLLCWVLNCQCWKTRSDKSSNSWLAWSPAEHFSCCVYLAVPFTLLNLVHKCAGCFLTWILSLLSGHVMYVVNITTSVSPHHSLDGHGVYLFLLLLEIKAF